MGAETAVAPRPGVHRWPRLAVAVLSIALLYMSVFSVPPLITTFVEDLGLTHPEAGALMSMFLCGFLVTSALAGRLLARFDPTQLVVAGLLLGGASSLCFALTETYGVFLLCRAALGVAVGLAYAPGITFAASLFAVRRANLSVGVFISGVSWGIVVSFFATPLLERALDWRWPFWIFGSAAVAGALLFRAVAGGVATSERRAEASERIPTRHLVRQAPVRLLLLALFLGMFAAYGVFTWVAPYLDESAGFSTAQISATAAVMAFTGIPAALGGGWLASRLGNPFVVSAAGFLLPLVLIVFVVSASPPLGLAVAVATIAAFGVATGNSPLYAVPPMLFGRAAGSASGLAASAGMSGALISSYAGGWLVDTSGYGAAFGVYMAAAACACFVIVPMAALSTRRTGALADAR
jgi:predicted MFS family arabinose efflux permease